MAVSPDNNNQAFRVTGDYSGNGSSGYTKLRCSEGTENQYIIKDQVVVNRKYLTEEELRQYESEPIALEPWDPMGSLA